MSAQAVITVKTDPKIKKQAQELAKEFGISLSGIINGYLRQFVRKREVHFDGVNEIPNEKTAKILDEIDEDIKQGKNLHGPFYSADDFIKALKS